LAFVGWSLEFILHYQENECASVFKQQGTGNWMN